MVGKFFATETGRRIYDRKRWMKISHYWLEAAYFGGSVLATAAGEYTPAGFEIK